MLQKRAFIRDAEASVKPAVQRPTSSHWTCYASPAPSVHDDTGLASEGAAPGEAGARRRKAAELQEAARAVGLQVSAQELPAKCSPDPSVPTRSHDCEGPAAPGGSVGKAARGRALHGTRGRIRAWARRWVMQSSVLQNQRTNELAPRCTVHGFCAAPQ